MSPRDPNRRRPLSREERALWSTITRSLVPLREGAPDEPPTDDAAEAPAAPAPRKRAVKPAFSASPPPPPQPTPPPPSPPLTQLGRRMRGRVARGKHAIDARLDLHGHTQNEAHAALLRFVRANSARGARLVLVITGKGVRGDGEGGRGVLRRQVPHWLRLPEFRAFVIGFEDAHIAHGGEGALYVRLRRLRGE